MTLKAQVMCKAIETTLQYQISSTIVLPWKQWVSNETHMCLKRKLISFYQKSESFSFLPFTVLAQQREKQGCGWILPPPPSGLNRVKPHFASQTSWLHFELLPWQQNYRRYLAGFVPKISEKSAICKDIEIKFDIDTKFGPLSS